MANNVIDWAYQFDLPHHLEKFVLVTLADDATKAGTCYYIGSMRNLAKLCSISERQARRVVRRLESFGLMLTSPQERNNGSSTSNVYQLRITIDPKTWTVPDGMKGGKRRAQETLCKLDEETFRKALASRMNAQSFSTWIGPMQIATVEKNGRLILRVPNPFFVEYLRDRSSMLLEVAKEIEPSISKIHFLVMHETL